MSESQSKVNVLEHYLCGKVGTDADGASLGGHLEGEADDSSDFEKSLLTETPLVLRRRGLLVNLQNMSTAVPRKKTPSTHSAVQALDVKRDRLGLLAGGVDEELRFPPPVRLWGAWRRVGRCPQDVEHLLCQGCDVKREVLPVWRT